MNIDNSTPWDAIAVSMWTIERQRRPVLIVKTGYSWDAQGKLTALPTGQSELEVVDRFYDDDPENRSIESAGDLVPFKDGFEVVLAGTAYSPEPAPMFTVSAKLVTPGHQTYWHKELHILGPHHWQRGFLGWVPSSPEHIKSLPLCYEYAYGGKSKDKENKLNEMNPVGLGYSVEADSALPQIQTTPYISQRKHKPAPVGFGPIAPHWYPRSKYFSELNSDDAVKGACPYKYAVNSAIYNVAPTDQQFREVPPTGSKLELINLHPEQAIQLIELPSAKPVAMVNDVNVELLWDTLIVDCDHCKIYQVWRGIVPVTERQMMSEDISLTDNTVEEVEQV